MPLAHEEHRVYRRKDWSPAVELTSLSTVTGTVTVVRDDLLRGGTKQRAGIPFLKDLRKHRGVTEFVYASPFSGFAQVALAVSCQAIGSKCTIFAERDRTKPSKAVSEFTRMISGIAQIELVDNLAEAEQEAARYANKPGLYKVPLGFNDPSFKQHLKQELGVQWKRLCSKVGFIPRRLWVPVGSGTLADIFHKIVPKTTKLACVDVKVLPSDDERIERIKNLINVEYNVAPQLFSEPVMVLPPVPSNRFYDAKLWTFVRQHATTEEVWWNVAS